MKGILLLALGHESYGRLAYNCAATIKAVSNQQVCLAYQGNALTGLTPDQVNTFDQLVEVPEKYTHINGNFHPFYTKTCLDKITPYDQTIFVDADTLVLKDLSFYYTDSFRISVPAYYNYKTLRLHGTHYTYWVEAKAPKRIQDWYKYGKNILPQTYSGIIAWGETNVFEKARKYYKENPSPADKFRGKNGTYKPDEYCFNIALWELGIELDINTPIYVNVIHDKPVKQTRHQIIHNFYGFTCNGNTNVSNKMKVLYKEHIEMLNYKKDLEAYPEVIKKTPEGKIV